MFENKHIFFSKSQFGEIKKNYFWNLAQFLAKAINHQFCNVYFRHDEAFENRRFAVGGSLPQHGAAELPSCHRLVRQRGVRRWNLLGWERILRLRQNEPNRRRRFEDSRRNDAERLFGWRQLVVVAVAFVRLSFDIFPICFFMSEKSWITIFTFTYIKRYIFMIKS